MSSTKCSTERNQSAPVDFVKGYSSSVEICEKALRALRVSVYIRGPANELFILVFSLMRCQPRSLMFSLATNLPGVLGSLSDYFTALVALKG